MAKPASAEGCPSDRTGQGVAVVLKRVAICAQPIAEPEKARRPGAPEEVDKADWDWLAAGAGKAGDGP